MTVLPQQWNELITLLNEAKRRETEYNTHKKLVKKYKQKLGKKHKQKLRNLKGERISAFWNVGKKVAWKNFLNWRKSKLEDLRQLLVRLRDARNEMQLMVEGRMLEFSLTWGKLNIETREQYETLLLVNENYGLTGWVWILPTTGKEQGKAIWEDAVREGLFVNGDSSLQLPILNQNIGSKGDDFKWEDENPLCSAPEPAPEPAPQPAPVAAVARRERDALAYERPPHYTGWRWNDNH